MFLSRDIRAASDRGPTSDFWYQPILSANGPVSPDQALRLSVVWACVKVLSETVGSTPIKLFRRLPNGGKERARDHPLYTLIAQRPNRWQTAMEWRELMQGHLSLRGNAYAEILTDARGRITDLVPLHPDRVRVEVTDGGFPRYRVRDGKSERMMLWSEMLHLRGLSADGYVGISPIECEREVVGEALSAQEYGRRFYQNDAQSSRWIEFSGSFKTKEDRDKFRENWQASQVGGNRFKTPVLESGMKLHEMGIKHTDAQFLETRRYKDTDIARIFRVPPHKVGILDKATFSNIEQQAIEFVQDTMLPWFVRWEQSLTMALLGPDEREDMFFEFLVDGLLRGDVASRAQFYSRGVLDGWLTRNEVREMENRNPIEGLDAPLEPLNMAPAGSRSNGEPDAPPDP